MHRNGKTDVFNKWEYVALVFKCFSGYLFPFCLNTLGKKKTKNKK